MITFRTARLAGVFCLALSAASPLWAQSAKSQLYGRGVHEYFGGNHQAALDALTGSIEAGTADPRPYYFRGLVLMATGKTEEARQDFQAGADREAADATRFYLVSKSLERVQGPVRLELENYRVSGRQKMNAFKQQENDARYGRIRASEPEMLRVPPKAGRLQPGADPFSDEPGQSEPGKAKPPVKAEVDADEAPVAPKKPAKEPVEEKPAAEEKEEKAEDKKPAKEPAEEKEEKAEEKKPAKEPAADEKEEKAEDKKPAKEPADEKPAAEEKAEDKKPEKPAEEKADEDKKPAEDKAEKPAEEKAEKPADKEEKAEDKAEKSDE